MRSAAGWRASSPSVGLAGISSEITGPAATASARLTGARMTIVQVSSAEEMPLTSDCAS